MAFCILLALVVGFGFGVAFGQDYNIVQRRF